MRQKHDLTGSGIMYFMLNVGRNLRGYKVRELNGDVSISRGAREIMHLTLKWVYYDPHMTRYAFNKIGEALNAIPVGG